MGTGGVSSPLDVHSLSESDREMIQALSDDPEALRRRHERVLLEYERGLAQEHGPVSQA